MKRPFVKFLCALSLCVAAALLLPAAASAADGREPIELGIGSAAYACFTVPAAGLDTDELYLNGVPYEPQLNQRGDIIVRTGDLLAAKVIGELSNAEDDFRLIGDEKDSNNKPIFQISNGKLTLILPDEGEAAPPPTTGAETDPNDNPFQYVEDRKSGERLAYPDEVIEQYSQALIDGIANLIKVLESEDVLMEYRNSDGSFSGNPAQDAGLPALLTYVTSLLSGDPVTAEAFDNAMYAIYSKLCVLDYEAGHTAVPISGNTARLNTNNSLLMLTFRTVMEQSGYSLPEYLSIRDLGVGNPARQGPWRENDYGKLDELDTATETATIFAGNGLRTWLHAAPSGKRLRLYNDGTPVTILTYGDAWCKVRIGSDIGYVMTKYLQFDPNGKLDELDTAWQKLKAANGFQLEGVSFELSDGAGNKQSLEVTKVWNSNRKTSNTLTVASEQLADGDVLEGVFKDQEMQPLLLYVSDGPIDAIYSWSAAGLPDGLSIAADAGDSALARLSGTPTAATDPDGSTVTVNVSTTVNGQLYEGSRSFAIVISEPEPEPEPPED